jgi:hypothetical protein
MVIICINVIRKKILMRRSIAMDANELIKWTEKARESCIDYQKKLKDEDNKYDPIMFFYFEGRISAFTDVVIKDYLMNRKDNKYGL